jgi:hypothetical protein
MIIYIDSFEDFEDACLRGRPAYSAQTFVRHRGFKKVFTIP